jgi:hypothetical protein
MKKTKFIGVVNGVEYNNVAEYNKAITEAMKAGDVDAYTKTVTVDNEPEQVDPGVCEECGYNDCECKQCEECGYNDCECKQCEENTIDYLPGFYESGDFLTSDYIDKNIGDLEKLWTVAQDINEELGEKMKVIIEELDDFQEGDFRDYLEDINEVLNKIAEDKAKNDKAKDTYIKKLNDLHVKLETIQKEIQEAKEVITIADRADALITVYGNFYNNLNNVVNNRYVNDKESPTTTMVEKKPQEEFTAANMDEIKSALHKILNAIFG